MIGILLLFIAIYTYITGKKVWSILLFISFCAKGNSILVDDIIGFKNADLAFLYTFIICWYSYKKERTKLYNADYKIKSQVKLFSIFMLCSVFFSYFHYDFTPFQILQGSRTIFIFLAYYFLRKTKPKDTERIIKIQFYITIVHSILYIIEVLTKLPVLPYGEASVDPFTGVARYYNAPAFLAFYIMLIFIYPNYLVKKWKFAYTAILLAAMLCTQGRTAIFTSLFFVGLGLLLKGELSKTARYVIITSICLLPFADMLTARFEGEKGQNKSEYQEIFSGEFIDNAKMGKFSNGTMSYRLSWVAERMLYLSNRPILENVFGLGLISDSQTQITQRKYNFKLGLLDERGDIVQLTTPDIAYGNMITQYGYVGSIIWILLWVQIFLLFYKRRKEHPLFFTIFILICSIFFGSFSGPSLSSSQKLILPFLTLSLITHKYTDTQNNAIKTNRKNIITS